MRQNIGLYLLSAFLLAVLAFGVGGCGSREDAYWGKVSEQLRDR